MEYLVVRAAGRDLALDVRRVREIVAAAHVTRVPGAAPARRGITALRGRTVPVVDLALRLGGAAIAIGPRTPLVVVEARVEDAEIQVALLVEASEALVTVPETLARPPTLESLDGAPTCTAFVLVEGALVPVLDVEAVVASGRAAAARGERPPTNAAERPPKVAPRDAAPCTDGAVAPRDLASGATAFVASELRTSSEAASSPLAVPRDRDVRMRRLPERVAPRRSPAGPDAPPPPASSVPRAHAAVTPAPPARPQRAPVARPSFDSPRAIPARSEDRTAGRIGGWTIAAGAAAVLAAAAVAVLRLEPTTAATAAAETETAAGAGAARAPATATATEPAAAAAAAAAAEAAAATPIPTPTPTSTSTSTLPLVPPREPAMTRAGPIPPLDPCAIHGVERGDTLWGLAARRLGDPHRWPQIYAANRDVVAHPDRIVPGERLRIDCEAPLSSTAAPTRTPP